MSDNRHYKGTLTEIKPRYGEDLELLCKRILGVDEVDGFYDCYADQIIDEHCQEHFIINDKLFKVDKEEYDPNEIFNLKKVSEGKYEFEVMYYDGGCGFDEALEECFKRNKGE